jgi:hypothetical protein
VTSLTAIADERNIVETDSFEYPRGEIADGRVSGSAAASWVAIDNLAEVRHVLAAITEP